MGRRLGELIYLFDLKHRRIAQANIRHAFKDRYNYQEIKKISLQAYQAFGQNLMEISFIGRINKQYLKKYITIENKENIEAAFKRGKGVIFLIVHEGNWELSNIICANLGFPFTLFVRDQGFPKLNNLLNSYRLKQGAKVIHKHNGIRQLIEILKNNESIGMTVDQGGKSGEIVKFFGHDAAMSVGAVKLALKYDCAIIPVFYTRIRGPFTKIILDQVYTVTKSGNSAIDLKENLQKLINIYEKYIRQYPQEYLWTYKIWKYGREREVLIITDGKAGHLRQSEGVAKLVSQQLSRRGLKTNLSIREVEFRSKISRGIFNLFHYRLSCLLKALTANSGSSLANLKPDIIISAGGTMSMINYLLAQENQAKSICLMRPKALSLKKFDLVVVPQHDQIRVNLQNKNKNVVITEGALNLIDSDYLQQKSKRLEESGLLKGSLLNPCIGMLIGGNSRNFSISAGIIQELARQVKEVSDQLKASILISTSRRSSPAVEEQIKSEFSGYARCQLLIIANANNNPDVVGGILGLSSIIIISPESISMISEAVAAKKHVLVFKGRGLSQKHQRFLKNYQDQGYIYLKSIEELGREINRIWQNKPKVNFSKDNLKVNEALNKIL